MAMFSCLDLLLLLLPLLLLPFLLPGTPELLVLLVGNVNTSHSVRQNRAHFTHAQQIALHWKQEYFMCMTSLLFVQPSFQIAPCQYNLLSSQLFSILFHAGGDYFRYRKLLAICILYFLSPYILIWPQNCLQGLIYPHQDHSGSI